MSETCINCGRDKAPATGPSPENPVCYVGHPDFRSRDLASAADYGCLSAGFHDQKARADVLAAELAEWRAKARSPADLPSVLAFEAGEAGLARVVQERDEARRMIDILRNEYNGAVERGAADLAASDRYREAWQACRAALAAADGGEDACTCTSTAWGLHERTCFLIRRADALAMDPEAAESGEETADAR